MKHVYLTFNPLGMVHEALTQDDAPGWHAHIEVDPGEEEEVQRRLEVLPAVAEDEYYALSTRFDVIAALGRGAACADARVGSRRRGVHGRGLREGLASGSRAEGPASGEARVASGRQRERLRRFDGVPRNVRHARV